MVKQVNTNPVIFNPVARTLDFSAWASFDIRRLMAVINDSRNVLIYAVANNGIGLIKESSTNTLIKLQCDTTNHAPNDILTVLYDDALQFEITNFSITLPPNASTETKQDILNNKIVICDTSDVEITSSVLPTGGSTSQLQTVGNNSLSSIDTKLPSLSAGKIPVETNLTPLTNTQLRASAVPVSGTFWQATQPVSLSTLPPITGNVSINNYPSTQAVSAISLPLPTGAATSALQTTGNNILSNLDATLGAKTDLSATGDSGTFSLISLIKKSLANWTSLLAKIPNLGSATRVLSIPVNIASDQIVPVSGTFWQQTQPISGSVGITNSSFGATQSGTWNLNNISGTITLPSGAATSSLQSTANTSLSSIDTKIPAKGQALTADSLPVVLPLSQITALTPPTTVNANITNLGQQTSNNSIPVVLANNQTALPITTGNYAQIVDDQTTFIYIGNSTVGNLTSSATWSIKKITFIGSIIKTEWASSTDLFDKIWDNRSTYIYS